MSAERRHTLATSLLRHGATLTHIRRYLGHVSRPDGRALRPAQPLRPGRRPAACVGRRARCRLPRHAAVRPAAPLTREQAQALAIDLSRRSTPADGGFCTFQPVVDGGACPWNLDCHNCAKFVLSGADLLYWRRKREQWYSIAERAPDNATAATCTTASPPPPLPSTGWKLPWPASACSTTRSPWTCAAPGLLPAGLEHRLPRHRARHHRRQPGSPPRRPATPAATARTSWRKQHDPRPHRGRDRGPPPRHRAETPAGPRRRHQPQTPQGPGHLSGRRPPGRGIPHLPLRQPRRPRPDQRRRQQTRRAQGSRSRGQR